MTDIYRFRSLPLRGDPVQRVDREQRVIFGVSCAQAVEALGHDMVLDDKTIQQIVEHGNSAKRGVKSRFTHPGLSSDGLGKYLGRLRDFRKAGDKAVADLHLADSAFKTPDGNLGDYVMDMAEFDPDAFGMSVVIDTQRVWVLDNGQEVGVDGDDRPRNATTALPVVRINQLIACDAVDEPAANRDGIFAARNLWATNQLAQEAFSDIDDYLTGMGMTPERAFQFALQYCAARGVDLKEFKGMETQGTLTIGGMIDAAGLAAEAMPAILTTAGQLDILMPSSELSALKADVEALRAQLAAEAEQKAEAKQRADQLQDALDRSNERVAALEAKARRERFGALAGKWFGDTAQHVAVLERLAADGGEDGDLFAAYVEQQNAVAEMAAKSALFKEFGTDKAPARANTAAEQADRLAKQKVKEGGIPLSVALSQVFEEMPELYRQYVTEQKAGGN